MRRPETPFRIFLLICLSLLMPAQLFAQAQTNDAVDDTDDNRSAVVVAVKALQDQVRGELEKAGQTLDDLRKKVDEAATVDSDLSILKIKADGVGKVISGAMAALESRYNLVAKRLDELGQPPADGQPEEEVEVASDRKRLQGEKTQMNGIISDGEVLSGEAGKLSDHITDLRRKLFTQTLFRRTVITPEMLDETAGAAVSESSELATKTSSSLTFMWNFKRTGLFAALGLSIVAAFLLRLFVRKAFEPLIRRDDSAVDPPYIMRLSKAFWSTLIPTIAVTAFVFTCLVLLYYFRVLRDDIGQIVQALLWVCAIVFFVVKLTRAVVAPGKPAWRLIGVSDRGARLLVFFATIMVVVNSASYFVAEIIEALSSPVVLSVARGFIASLITGILMIRLAFMRAMKSSEPGGPDQPWPQAIRGLFLFMGIGLILTVFSGYIGLAQFAATQIVVTGALAVTMYIGFLTGQAVSRPNALAATAGGRLLQKRRGLTAVQLDQLGLLGGLGIYVLVVVLFVPLIMLQWGFQAPDIAALFLRLFTEIKIGSITISLMGILGGLLVFVGGYFATRWFQRWVDTNVMARSQVDIGVRNSVGTALGYAGIAIAGLIGISAAGINLSSLALVAGALSLGIGFGLQTIVQNFVSGLILLAERPFKVGDWIVNGPVEGFVRRISVRATEIETFQNQSIIVPNSQLINAAVGNWTLRNTLARSEVQVSVAYDSDPRQVMELLLDIARSHPLVLTMPEPNIGFQAFGQYTLDFELRFYLADLFQGGGVKNDIRITILERFREEGIVIPVAQPNVVLHTQDDASALEKALAEEGLSPEAARRVARKAEGLQKPDRERMRDMDLVDDDSGPHDGLHHAIDVEDADGDGEPDNQNAR